MLLVQSILKINNAIYDLLTYILTTSKRVNLSSMGEELPHGETVDELRRRLNEMKRLMAERQLTGMDLDENKAKDFKNPAVGVIDGSFLSWVFGVALLVIVTVSVYAFYNLYHAILKKFPSHHTEL